MKKILLIGAGRSASTLINYLLDLCQENEWQLTIADIDESTATQKANGLARGIGFDIHNVEQKQAEIGNVDLVISMLPAKFHALVAEACLELGKHLVTASYVTPEMTAIDEQVKEKGLIFLNECGLDPGIDHMSAMKILDEIRDQGGELVGFESFTGGLIAPNERDNPWQYKFTWNPRNVVLAGQGVVKFIQNNRYKYIPYHKLFKRTEVIHIPGYGYFEGYANRDSLKYLDVYNLQGINTLYRGTLRRPGFCRAWDVFVQLGATDDTYEMESVSTMTHRQFINQFLSYNPHDSVELKLAHYMGLEMESEVMHKLIWMGIFSDEPVGLDKGTPAQILEHILKKKWTLEEDEDDMIVMWHKFNFIDKQGEEHEVHSTMVATGEDPVNTAMSKTVGLPLGIATKLILTGEINERGVRIPISKGVYTPILKDLKKFGFDFIEEKFAQKQPASHV